MRNTRISTLRCYVVILDFYNLHFFNQQAYSWALEGMKFVAMLDMERCKTSADCQNMIDEFDKYMTSHPAISDVQFEEIFAMARHYGNKKCMRQCEFAKEKCTETRNLFDKRRELLTKVCIIVYCSNINQ